MTTIHFANPHLLWGLPIALIPFISYGIKQFDFPGLADWPKDYLSDCLRWGVRAIASATIASLILASAGPFADGGTTTRVGVGAEIVVVLDRSGSMSEMFQTTDQSQSAKSMSKIEAARKVLLKFMDKRPADTFGLVAFNAAPISVAPLSADRALAKAALQSAESQSSGFTALGRALAMGLDYFEGRPYTASRLILLVSDGDATIEPEDQEVLRQEFSRQRAQLMWIFVNNTRQLDVYDTVIAGDHAFESEADQRALEKDANASMHKVFSQLDVPYQAFEVNSEAGFKKALHLVDKATNKPTRYQYRLPRQDYAVYLYGIAFLLIGLLFWFKQLEIKRWKPS